MIIKNLSIILFVFVTLFGVFSPLLSNGYSFSDGLFGIERTWYSLSVVLVSFLFLLVGRFFSKTYLGPLAYRLRALADNFESGLMYLKPLAGTITYIILIVNTSIVLYYVPIFISESSQRFELFGEYGSLYTKLALLGGVVASLSNKGSLIRVWLLLVSVAIFMIIMSRSLALVLLIFSFSLFFKKKPVKGSIFLVLSILGYWYAVTFRGVDFNNFSYAYSYFIDNLNDNRSLAEMVEFLLNKVVHVDFASSISVALKIHDEMRLDFIEYIIYILSLGPFPSSLLPDQVYFFGSLTRAAGLSIGVGINTDILSEPYLMFGWIGVAVMWFTFGVIFSLFEVAASNNHNQNSVFPVVILCLPLVAFFMLGTVASIRASTRMLWWIIMLIIIASFLFRKKR